MNRLDVEGIFILDEVTRLFGRGGNGGGRGGGGGQGGGENGGHVDHHHHGGRFASTSTPAIRMLPNQGGPSVGGIPSEALENHPDVDKVHERTSPFCFVPLELLNQHVINTPVSDMDVWIPG
jgi:hypothetical protein